MRRSISLSGLRAKYEATGSNRLSQLKIRTRNMKKELAAFKQSRIPFLGSNDMLA